MSTFPLSSGTDNVAGTSGSDLITGSGADWQVADTINGGAGNDAMQITALKAAQGAVTDSLFQHVSSIETLALLGKFAETATLGALSDAAGLLELDGSGLTGNLTVDASARSTGIIVDSAKGANTLTGSIDNDTFRFTSAGLSGTDKVNGGGNGDTDTIQITDKAAVTDAAFKQVTHVEHLALGGGAVDYTGQKVTLGAFSVAAGIVEVDVLDGQGATLDASARATGVAFHGGTGNDVFKASQGNDTFVGGIGEDSFQIKGAFLTAQDAIDGGAGIDEIRILDSGTALTDADFTQVNDIERLVFDASGKQTVTLGNFAAQADLVTIDASKVSGSLNLTIGNAFNPLSIMLGSGADTLVLGSGNKDKIFVKSSNLNAADTITGNANKADELHFTDTVKLTDKYFLGLSKVTNVGGLFLDSDAKGQTFVAGDNFKNFVAGDGLKSVVAIGDAKDSSVTFDFSQYTGNKLIVVGSGGSDVFLAGTIDTQFFGTLTPFDQGGAESFRFHSADLNATDVVQGGKSLADEIAILDAGTAIVDADFTNLSKVETLRLAAAGKSGNYQVTMGTEAMDAGFTTVDATSAGVGVTVNAAAMTTGITVLAGAKDNVLTGGSGDDTFVFNLKDLNGSDFVTGGKSTSGDTLKLTSGGAISGASLANVQGIEVVQFSDKGNAVVLTDSFMTNSQGAVRTYAGYAALADTFIVTGKGKDTVDLSQLNNFAGHAVVIGSAGGDKYIGSAKADTFVFRQADLTATTQIAAGAGLDALALGSGSYAASQFKGMTGIDALVLGDGASGNYAITLDNALFKSADQHLIEVAYTTPLTGTSTIDASAVTDPTASLVVFPSGGGTIDYKGGAGNDAFYFSIDNAGNSIDGTDLIDGGGGVDTVAITGSYNGTVALGANDFGGVRNVETLVLAGVANTKFTLWLDDVHTDIREVNGLGAADQLTIDMSLMNADVTVHAGQAAGDIIYGGTGNDTIVFENAGTIAATLTSADLVDGAAGTDTLKFVGDVTVNDAAFTQVTSIEQVAFKDGSFNITLGAKSDAAGVTTIDASAANTSGFIIGTASANALTIHGSSEADLLKGGTAADHIIGGKGGDILYGGGASDVFVYESAADSHQLAGNDVSHVDVIADFTSGDTIDVSALLNGPVAAVDNHGTVGSFITADTAGYFSGEAVAAAYDGANTRVYVDANGDGNFNLNTDVVIQLIGNHLADAANAATYV